MWSDSFAKVNPREIKTAIPLDSQELPEFGEPGAATLALLVTLYENDAGFVVINGWTERFDTILSSPYVYIPHDSVIPGSAALGDHMLTRMCLCYEFTRINGVNQRFGGPPPTQQYATEFLIQKLKTK